MVDHIGIYGSKVAEGLSAFQRRSCLSMHFFTGRKIYEEQLVKASFIISCEWLNPLSCGSNMVFLRARLNEEYLWPLSLREIKHVK